MIAINWGTSNFRAYRLDAEGNVAEERSSARGAMRIAQGGFADALMAEVGSWIRAGESRVLMSGMVGARSGWREVPYVRLPVDFATVVAGVVGVEANGVDARIVPGLIGADESGVPEVMRGEETEIFGLRDESVLAEGGTLCLPGTHTKWATVREGEITRFSTSMTGDMYNAIREGTILRSVGEHEMEMDAFRVGVERAIEPGDVAHHLFGVRTLVLTGKMRESAAPSYLSGILIGHEVKARAKAGGRVHLIGDQALCALYAIALRAFQMIPSVEPAGAAVRGLWRIAEGLTW
jgi:2-dehydro-3-deoxygalactonokinase